MAVMLSRDIDCVLRRTTVEEPSRVGGMLRSTRILQKQKRSVLNQRGPSLYLHPSGAPREATLAVTGVQANMPV